MKSEIGQGLFEDGQRAYREAYEANIAFALENPKNPFMQRLKVDEELILLGNPRDSFYSSSEYSISLGNQLLPLALPLNPKSPAIKGSHNLLQLYLFADDENLSSLAERAGVSRQCMDQNLHYQAEKLLRSVPHVAKKYPSGIRFSKDYRKYTEWLKSQIDSGRSYDDLLASGVSPFRLHGARIIFNQRQKGLAPEYRIIY